MLGGDKTGISQLFVKHCEQTESHPTMQRHLERVEAKEVLDCTYPRAVLPWETVVKITGHRSTLVKN